MRLLFYYFIALVETFSRAMRLVVLVLRISINLMCGHFFFSMPGVLHRFPVLLSYRGVIVLARFEVLVLLVHLYIFSFLYYLYSA